ncbi:MAG: hypothetical protein WBX78_25525, partial [Pseudolabrys sp.]
MAQRSGSPCQIQGTLSGGRVINAERFAQLFLPLVWPVPALLGEGGDLGTHILRVQCHDVLRVFGPQQLLQIQT